jgi:hypothetical protein
MADKPTTFNNSDFYGRTGAPDESQSGTNPYMIGPESPRVSTEATVSLPATPKSGK